MTESLWNKYDISRKSLEVLVKRSPKVARKDRELALNEARDSTAIGWKIYELVIASLRLAARSVAAPADRAEDDVYDIRRLMLGLPVPQQTSVYEAASVLSVLLLLLLFAESLAELTFFSRTRTNLATEP